MSGDHFALWLPRAAVGTGFASSADSGDADGLAGLISVSARDASFGLHRLREAQLAFTGGRCRHVAPRFYGLDTALGNSTAVIGSGFAAGHVWLTTRAALAAGGD